MNKISGILGLLIVFSFNQTWGLDLSTRPTLVAGFINQGQMADEGENIIITKTLINALSKIPGSRVSPYDETLKIASNYKFWKNKSPDKDLAIRMAQELGYKQVITGDFQIDKLSNTIRITVLVYDVVTGDLALQRKYIENTSFGTIDAVMTMQGNLIGLLSGKQRLYTLLKIKVESSANIYSLYINGKKTAEISQTNAFADRFLTEEPVEASIRLGNTGREVYRELLTPTAGKTNQIIYKPFCSVVVKVDGTRGDIYLDSQYKGSLDRNKTLTLSAIDADRPQTVSLKRKNRMLDSAIINLPEGENGVVVFGQKYGMIDYGNSTPTWNWALPGFAQFQAEDYWMGSLFTGAAVVTLGYTGFCVYGFLVTLDKVENAQSDSFRKEMADYNVNWILLTLVGVAAYGLEGGLSYLHAVTQPTYLSPTSDITIEGPRREKLLSVNLKF